ncbi:hypothetical protein SAMN02745775_13018 [Falsiroseomonas stagni DSM 19981]|uniref:Uncharacterized protein n=1 Tax=Falsiroseomonas stagni DSM 19981 TaxID=1123062 RepID=A0A1I4FH89_9PROT|nr:hypothetical protein SAMN02745775_13018 [Falsiroseomonas stagni DSM 19981]
MEADGLVVVGERRVEVAAVAVDIAAAGECLGIIRIESDGLIVVGERRVEAAAVAVDIAPVGEGRGAVLRGSARSRVYRDSGPPCTHEWSGLDHAAVRNRSSPGPAAAPSHASPPGVLPGARPEPERTQTGELRSFPQPSPHQTCRVSTRCCDTIRTVSAGGAARREGPRKQETGSRHSINILNAAFGRRDRGADGVEGAADADVADDEQTHRRPAFGRRDWRGDCQRRAHLRALHEHDAPGRMHRRVNRPGFVGGSNS